jgi:murein DD-endopeptidase MepM/ murein hydrolase activator NlpD
MKRELQATTANYNNTKKQLENLQTNLISARNKYNNDQKIAGQRLREIYKGERINFLTVIFEAENINTFLDRIYYQQILTKKDAERLNNLKAQVNQLAIYTAQVEDQKRNILYAMAKIENKKNKIAQDIYTSQYLIKKLQTDRKTYEQAERELASQSDKLTKMLRGAPAASGGNIVTTAGFLRPVGGPITSPFGWRQHPIFGSRTFHSGIDIGAPFGSPVKASNSGSVVYVGWYGGYGKVVIVNHGNYNGKPTSTLYAHLSSYSVSNGATVAKGQIIGHVGSTGYSTGPHLHFEVRENGSPVNPLGYVK